MILIDIADPILIENKHSSASIVNQTLNYLILLFSSENHCSIEFLIQNRNLGSYDFLS